MIDAQLPLQAAIVAAVKGDAVLNGLIGGRIFDRMPTNNQGQVTAQHPFISFGVAETLDDSTPCHRLTDCYVDLNAMSREVGYVEVKKIGARAVALLNTALPVAGFTVKIHRVERLTYQREADGLTSRAIIRLRYRLAAQV